MTMAKLKANKDKTILWSLMNMRLSPPKNQLNQTNYARQQLGLRSTGHQIKIPRTCYRYDVFRKRAAPQRSAEPHYIKTL